MSQNEYNEDLICLVMRLCSLSRDEAIAWIEADDKARELADKEASKEATDVSGLLESGEIDDFGFGDADFLPGFDPNDFYV